MARKKQYTAEDVVAELRRRRAKTTLAKLGEQLGGVSPPYLRDVLVGNREPGPRILEAMGFRRIEAVHYERL